MAVPPYNQETCYPLSSFQDPHEPWYEQPMFNPVQLGYVVMYYGWYDSLQVGPQDYSVGASN